MRLALLTLLAVGSLKAAQTAVTAELEIIPLPPLQVRGQPARAHTQGIEIVDGRFYVTARLETAKPKRAILVRATSKSAEWDTWDITPTTPARAPGLLDHPGGFQSDGERLWIPVSESVRHGRTVIRVFALARLAPGQIASSEFDFPVMDHVGALAVATNQSLVLGASWDTETVYVWDLKGKLQRTLTGRELKSRGLGIVSGPDGYAGVAVQDWKMYGDSLYASGLLGNPDGTAPRPKSRLLVFTHFLEPKFECETIRLPNEQPVELAQEAMVFSRDFIYFLPEDLGSSNRCFRFHPTTQPRM